MRANERGLGRVPAAMRGIALSFGREGRPASGFTTGSGKPPISLENFWQRARLARRIGGGMFDFILAPANLPFSVALALMLMIGAVEALGLGLGSVHLDMHADVHADLHVDGDLGVDPLGWLG